jgi:7-carboxy-7-deazaguanine synthase (Cx14CxxC type)
MGYAVKELFYTLQGEGAQAGRAAVFVRLTGCNLWSGREADRATAACTFCDTDFVGTDGPGGGRFDDARSLARAAAARWGAATRPFAVLTGGEPLLQVDAELTGALRAEGFELAVKTNGTRPVPPGIDWVCVSPKGAVEVLVRSGDELTLGSTSNATPRPNDSKGSPFATSCYSRSTARGSPPRREPASSIAWPIRVGDSLCKCTRSSAFGKRAPDARPRRA